MRIGVDFDRVLFMTDKFKEYLNEEVEGMKEVETPPYNEHGVYSPEIHAKMCGIDVENIYQAMENLEKFLYEDVDQLDNTDHELILITRGQEKFQKKKIEGTGIDEKFENIIIVEKGSKDVRNIDFLIDDRRKEIEEAGLPGFEFDSEKHSLQEALEEAERHEA